MHGWRLRNTSNANHAMKLITRGVGRGGMGADKFGAGDGAAGVAADEDSVAAGCAETLIPG